MNCKSIPAYLPALVAGILINTCIPSGVVMAQSLQPITIEYVVSLDSDKLGNATLGKTETVLSRTATGYAVASKTKAQGLAAIIIGSNEQQSCEFSIEDGRAVARKYSGGRTDSSDYEVKFDWQQRKIGFSNGDNLDMPNGYVVDNCNMPFAAALMRDKGLGSEILYVVDGRKKRIRGYNQQSSSIEKIDTILGAVDTLKIVLSRDIKPERTFTLWLSPDHDYVPIKMEEKRRSRTTTMTANRIDN